MENLHSTPRIKQKENNKKYSPHVVLFLWFQMDDLREIHFCLSQSIPCTDQVHND